MSKDIRFSSKTYRELNDDELYELICNLNWQLHCKQPNGPIYRGLMSMQYPQDLIAYNEIIWRVKPTLVVETGTAGGGCTMLFASVMDDMMRKDLINDYRIVTIDHQQGDLHPVKDVLEHPRIVYVNDDSVSDKAASIVRSHWKPGVKTMVFLDSTHSKDHVLREMALYGPLVSVKSYMIVQDTCLGYYRLAHNGPLHAVEEFLKEHGNWEIDRWPERWLNTQNPCGYLKKVN